MLKCLAVTTILLCATSPVLAASVTCRDLNIPVEGAADDTVITLTVGPEDILKQCTSSANRQLAVVTPENGVQLSPQPGETLTIPFIVEDPQGNIGEAVIIVSRNRQTNE